MTPSSEHEIGRICVSCGRPIDWNSETCEHCGHKYKKDGRRRLVAGILVLISGLDFLQLLLSRVGGWEFYDYHYEGRLALMAAVIILAAGILILKRRDFAISSIGAILSWTMWVWEPDEFAALIGGSCGFIGFVLLMVSRSDFSGTTESAAGPTPTLSQKKEGLLATHEKCQVCGNQIERNWNSCPLCGTSLRTADGQDEEVCPNCGEATRPGWKKCPHCAARLRSK